MADMEFRSPIRKLVVFFRASRDKWKQKCQQTKYEFKLLKRRYANLTRNRDQWKQRYQESQARVDALVEERAALS